MNDFNNQNNGFDNHMNNYNKAIQMTMTGMTQEQIFMETGINPVEQNINIKPFFGKQDLNEQ